MATATTRDIETEDILPVRSRVSWGAILAGAVVALAIYFLFTVLGTAIGLTAAEDAGGKTVGVGAAVYAVVVTLLSLFLGGYITSLCAVGENKLEAAIYGIIVWGVVFFSLLWLMVSGIRLSFNAVIGVASTAPAQEATQRLSREDARASGMEQGQVDRMQQRAQEFPQEARQRAGELAPAAWWTFAGIMLSMLAAIGGALAGAGPTLLFRGYSVRTTPATIVPPAGR